MTLWIWYQKAQRGLAAAGEGVGMGVQEAVAELRLALGQAGHDPVALLLDRSSPVLAYISAQADRYSPTNSPRECAWRHPAAVAAWPWRAGRR